MSINPANPRCDDCGTRKTRAVDRRFSDGYRWRCPNCEAA